ncbi:MAG: PD-(D/E)XK nuclease family protein [Candidatus Poseidoniales archaeon]
MFRNELVEVEEIQSVTTESGRVYETPDGRRYPSVTTVLGRRPEKLKSLLAWRKRVGEEQANRISTQASRRGTAVHTLMENYIIHGQEPDKKEMPTSLLSFRSLQKVIDENLEVVRGVEIGLYSHHLKLAGRCDLVGQWSGRNAIIDFKTSRKLKKEEWIEDYFLQCTAYSIMFEELTGIKTTGIVVLVAVDDYDMPQVFMKNRNQYTQKLLEIINENTSNTNPINDSTGVAA